MKDDFDKFKVVVGGISNAFLSLCLGVRLRHFNQIRQTCRQIGLLKCLKNTLRTKPMLTTIRVQFGGGGISVRRKVNDIMRTIYIHLC